MTCAPEPPSLEVWDVDQQVVAVIEPEPEPESISDVWYRLAQCESHGQWDYDPRTADWGSRIFFGGLQFHDNTWLAFKSDYHPRYASEATPTQQIEVAKRVLAAQTWKAWPKCSLQLGLRGG